jgi:uncharacterized membrane protein
MMSLIFILFVARAFYFMAEHYRKNKWGYAVLGVISFYGSAIAVTILLMGAGVNDQFLITVISSPVGLVTCRLTYVYLRKQWRQPPDATKNMDSLDSDLLIK